MSPLAEHNVQQPTAHGTFMYVAENDISSLLADIHTCSQMLSNTLSR